ncbi:endonuclease/exonuclease/phosphatase family domain-containing protein 1 isoform X6 [Physeter macrocephalus]|uniref:Endonuclease/exonuclease/phosphatase family domain-containing protein 1 isoform X6 n=1 Tax=Physeter macrocephalus TaxID=9755 RepID=A0A9W2WJK3_PHYMC|nr:endonuclease/exonuclease/phosphatase family domain-containing protein 1 isoform X6 [Physeter catodon]
MTHFLAPQAACSGNGFRREHILTCALSLQFCTELNQPILPNIRKWKGPRGCWKAVVSEKPSTQLQKGAGFAGFLWDTAAGVELRDATWQESSPGNGHGKPAGPSPYLVRFKVGSHDLTLVNLHLAALTLPGGENPSKSHSDSHCWASFVQTLQETLKGSLRKSAPGILPSLLETKRMTQEPTLAHSSLGEIRRLHICGFLEARTVSMSLPNRFNQKKAKKR